VDGQPYAWQSEGQGFESPRVHHRFRIRLLIEEVEASEESAGG